MLRSIGIEVGDAHSAEHSKAICRIVLNGERRCKISLTRHEAIELAGILRDGCVRHARTITFTLTLPHPHEQG